MRGLRGEETVSVTITLECGGCEEKAPGGRIVSEFLSFSGRSWGFGRFVERVKWDVPPGWTKFDPYTGCTYCPVCTKELGL